MARVRKFRLLMKVLKETHTLKILVVFLAFYFVCAFVIWFAEPEINTFPDALWYCFTVASTIGFGDLVVHTHLAKILSVILSVYAVVIIAIFTGVVVNFFTRMNEIEREESIGDYMDKLEHLPDLSKEELEELSDKIKEFRKKMTR